MPNVWRPLSRNVPDATDVGGTIILAASVAGHRYTIVLADQHDGHYSVQRLNPVRENGILVWKQLAHHHDLSLEAAFEKVKSMSLSAFSVAVQMADIDARMAAQQMSS